MLLGLQDPDPSINKQKIKKTVLGLLRKLTANFSLKKKKLVAPWKTLPKRGSVSFWASKIRILPSTIKKLRKPWFQLFVLQKKNIFCLHLENHCPKEQDP
jgi:hypothetical protein